MSKPDLQIRAYTEADETKVIALWEAAFPDAAPHNAPASAIERKLGTQRELFLVGVIDEQLVATVLGGYDGVRGWVYHMAVDEGHQRKRIGEKMMAAITMRLTALGCLKVNLQVRSTNNQVIAFYESIGFAVEDRVSMGKRLSEE